MKEVISLKKFEFNLPVENDEIKNLKLKDIVYLNGIIVTARDQAHQRIFDIITGNKSIPDFLKKLNGMAIYHCGPIIKCQEENYEFISGGPTTSQRMDKIINKIVKPLNIKFIIGKGGMENLNTDKNQVVYLSFTGGCGAIVREKVKEIKHVEWLDLGMCEALWFLLVENFGPLIVTQAQGKNLYNK
jgi:fumarate hydratase subunit beta